ncbi:branched-chain amino acid aminotransferase II [Eremomyces bilateralis CBS 781.70]|uniref:Branched-chain-amino-acid aminotransferase n=1 Tax=Eremomyces bilateralis CBS 781.70 TaxID=1392243 RepID=A0A6G1G9F5_9PEZI|nr:branched-chain amino acid aminotransferase II [Eremomyces bilateralis CBS 781.70]KAF1814540.1 branched-chain amino acid aminotransferase II [Eremomyces bilateralis CBS 781.70]
MPPAAIDTTSQLTSAGVSSALSKTAHSLTNGANGVSGVQLAELDASRITSTYTASPRPVPVPGSPEIAAQNICTDHMITAKWTVKEGWHAPALQPYGPLSLMPTASCLHYATECFEGLKLYRGYDGKLRLFRANLNAARMLNSATRIALPAFAPTELLKLIMKLCATDGPKWLPKDEPGSFLYLRPTMIASDPALGVQRPNEALLYVILTCFPRLDAPTIGADGSPQGMKLLASGDDTIRAWPGGFGHAKVGANYGPSLVAQGEARKAGYNQILWLFGDNCEVTEAGASNFFVVWRTRSGATELVTAPLDRKIILDGVTRRSVLQLVRERLSESTENVQGLDIVERNIQMDEIVQAAGDGRLLEAFAAGTAFFISPVQEIHFRGTDIRVPMTAGEAGPYTKQIKTWLSDIMYGKEHHEWGIVVEEQS